MANKKNRPQSLAMYPLRSGERIFKGFHVAMLMLFLLLTVYVVTLNPARLLPMVALSTAYLALSLTRHFLLVDKKYKWLQLVLPYIEGLVLYLLNSIDVTNSSLSLYMVHISDIAVDYDYWYSSVFSFAGYVVYMTNYVQHFPHLSTSMRILAFVIAAFQIFIYVGLAILARQYSVQRQQLQHATADLHAKIIALEQMTLLKERNRIAGDIHNTVGHQLTTVLVQIEAAQMLLDKDKAEVMRRLGIIKDQVRDGLHELRKSINAINADSDYEDFDTAVKRLLEQAKLHAGVEVEYEMDDISPARLAVKKSLYHVIMESVTNAIRHGNCNKMNIKLVLDSGIVRVSAFNNGTVPRDITYGFGLNQMKDSLGKLGGALNIRIDKSGWFGLVAEVPLHPRKDDGLG
jgi:signal transduction histidine kinase